MKPGAFSQYHPLVNFSYFFFVLAYTMFFMHPLCLFISFSGAFAWSVCLNGKKAWRFNLLVLLPMLFLVALINPLFNHQGITVLSYLPDGNPLTLESILYGVAAASMLAAVICWFSCFNAIITSDKFVYLFGRIIPALSLILAMVLRFVRKFKAQIQVVSTAQRCVGRDVRSGSLWQRLRHALRIFSIMITWTLESSIETADSMRSRGYGAPGRTSFAIYRFTSRDRFILALILILGLTVLGGSLQGGLYYRYFPSLQGGSLTVWSILAFAAYLPLCYLPLIIDVLEELKWKRIASGI